MLFVSLDYIEFPLCAEMLFAFYAKYVTIKRVTKQLLPQVNFTTSDPVCMIALSSARM